MEFTNINGGGGKQYAVLINEQSLRSNSEEYIMRSHVQRLGFKIKVRKGKYKEEIIII